MVLIRYIPNKFVDSKYEYEVQPGGLAKALHKFTLEYPEFSNPIFHKKTAVFVNGKNLTQEECINHVVKDGDTVEITHSIEGWIPVLILYVAIAAGIGYLFYKFGSMLYSMLPDWGMKTEDADTTQTYSWDGPSTSLIAEKPIPLIYGEHLVGGQYINFNVWSDGSDNWADILLALGEGEIAGIMRDHQASLITSASIPVTLENVALLSPYIKINDQFAEDFSDDSSYYTYWAGRVGVNKQTSIKGFRNQQSQYDYAKKVPALRGVLSDQWTSPAHTTYTDIDSFYIKLSCPALYNIYDSGKIKPGTIRYRSRHRVASPGGTPGAWVYDPPVAGGGVDAAGSWYAVKKKTKSEFKIYRQVTTASRDTYDIQIQRYSPESTELSTKKTVQNKLEVTHITEVIDEELAFPNTALLALRVKATDQISGSFPNIQTLVRGLKVRVPDLGGSREFNDYYWTGTSLQFRRLTDGGDLVSWDGVSYTTQWSSNPAYITRDILLNTRYGAGEIVDASSLDEDSIDDAGRKCWQKVTNASVHKNELNIVIDTEQDPQDILAQISQVSRLFIFQSSGYIKFKYEEDEDPVQVFSMGNIIKDSFKVDYVDYTKIPNRIEVTYANKNDGWKKNVLEVVDETEWSIGKPKRTQSFSLIGVTTKEQALREAKFLLNKARYVRKGIEFTTTIQACHSEPGDVIAFQHDVPQWGWGGRIIDGHNTATACELDQLVPSSVVAAPTDYDIKLYHSDDSITTASIASVDGKIVRIKSGQSFSPVPEEDNTYILGKEGSTIAEYRIQEVELTPEEEVQIRATEHNANIYSDTGLEISDEESTELPNPSEFAPQVTGLSVYEILNKAGIGISFRQPDDGLVGNAITLTDITAGKCTTSNTQKIQTGDKVKFTSGDFAGRIFTVGRVVLNTTFYLTDTSITDSGSPGVCYKYRAGVPLTWDHADIYVSTDNEHFEKIAEGYGDDAIEYYDVFPGMIYYFRVYSINKIGIKNITPATANIEFKGEAFGRPQAPTGLEIFGQGNDTEFSGRDCKVVWRLNAPFGGAGSLKPELPANIRADIAGALVKNFVVQVWDNSQDAYGNYSETSLVREEITTDKWFVYTYEKNFEDHSGVPVGHFTFRIFQNNYFEKRSIQYAKLHATTDTPSAPTGLSATPEEDGVTFIWDDVSDVLSDFDKYEYTIKVNSNAWSSWETTYDSNLTRWLTNEELGAQGTGRSTIKIKTRIVDLFTATSAIASVAASCNNYKGFFTISPTPGIGHFTTIASGIEAISNAGGTLLLKEGSHKLGVYLQHLPNVDITIRGVGDKTKVIANATSSSCFFIYGNSSTYRFSDFVASYICNATPTNFINCNATLGYGGALETNTADLWVTGVTLRQGTDPQPNKNEGVHYRGLGKVRIEDYEVEDGRRGITVFSPNVIINNSRFKRQRDFSVHLWSTPASSDNFTFISKNEFNPLMRYGVYLVGTGRIRGAKFTENTFVMNTATGTLKDVTGSSGADSIYCMYLKNLQRSSVSNNSFIFVNASKFETSLLNIHSLSISKSSNLTVSGNNLHASLDSAAHFDFINCSASTFTSAIVGNSVEMLNATSGGTWHGVHLLDSDKNVISDNVIKMGNRSGDTGILLFSDTESNYGRGNLVWDANVAVNDTSGNNDVLATLI